MEGAVELFQVVLRLLTDSFLRAERIWQDPSLQLWQNMDVKPLMRLQI